MRRTSIQTLLLTVLPALLLTVLTAVFSLPCSAQAEGAPGAAYDRAQAAEDRAAAAEAERDRMRAERDAALAELERMKRECQPSPSLSATQTNSVGMEFVLIPAGSFQMGCSSEAEECNDWEKPRHAVTISRPFYLGKHEVTQAQWQAVMGNNPSHFKGSDRPVENVSWDDIQEFIKKLNAKEGHNLYRLPTEAEWEYAARAGSQTAYSFGNDKGQLGNYAWYRDNAGQETHPVGQKQENAWGLHDMHGNVDEWVQDWYGSYSAGSVVDPQGPQAGEARVLRGGSWYLVARVCRSAFRDGDWPALRISINGFRLVRSSGH